MTNTSVPAPNALFRVVPHSIHQIGTNEWIVYVDRTGSVLECDGVVLNLLAACQGCRPLEGHLALSTLRGIDPDSADTRALLGRLIESGLLCEWSEPVPPCPEPSPRLPTTIAIVTADRPQQLRRCAQSFLGHFREHGHAVRLLVVDGSRSRENREANRVALAACSRECLTRVDLIVPDALETKLRHGANRGAAVRFLLTGGTTGANRNIVLLATAGEDVLMVDDDMVCEPWVRENRRDSVTLAGHSDLRHLAFFPTRAEAIAATIPTDVDFLAAHGRLLGRRVDELATMCQPDTLAEGCVHMTAALAGQPSLVIRATFAGLAGDAGTYCPQTLLFSTGRWKTALSTQATYDLAFASRECHRIADSYVLTHDPHFMAGCVALDNTVATPPFIPFGRNEDGVFGLMLGMCDPTIAYAHVPFGVIHDPDTPNIAGARNCLAATETRISETLIALLQSQTKGAMLGVSSRRLSRLGLWCKELSAIDLHAFRSLLTRALLERRQRELTLIDSAVSGRVEYPEYWVGDLIAYREMLLESMAHEEFFVPIEFRDSVPGGPVLPQVQSFIGELGTGLQEWPDLWQLCASNPDMLAVENAVYA